ncbi:glycosyltransferase [Actinoplanes friuliensis]|uniref:Polypeptide N-acetylgalactosaminyltransferase 5 n=1 Tax=Actinoplanes friuliensis DSM 7358 TaxID=1246995 RepID=U5VX79_9ACTN|nr:glycosyltransferase family 2 protein [Actinoplanes friuliensis]AGZ41484.1 Polypeptide N-acetylgalactosaminyltransferase 5 [Actinoplanes friuliensis DSM 7358]
MVSTAETVAVVVVTYNSERLIPDLLASLGPGLEGIDWHLTVADNASADDSVGAVRRLAPDATVVEMGRNAGYAAGINAAVAKAGPFTAVLVLNPDVRLTPGCIGTLLGTLRTPGTGIAVPLLVDGDGKLIQTMRREPSILRTLGDAVLGAGRAGRYPALGEVVTEERAYDIAAITDWAEGSTVLFSAECWERCGPWDESFFLYSEETDFALRARDAGLVTRFTPAAQAIHLEGDSRVSPRLWMLLTLNKVRLYRRRHNPVAAAGFWAALVLREGSRAALGKTPSRTAVRALLSPSRLREQPGPRMVHPNG